MIERSSALWALRGWMARRMERPSVFSAVQRAVGSHAVWTRLVSEIVRPHPGMRILDVGCGPADVLDFLPADLVYVGVDLHAPYVEHARKRHGARGTFHAVPVEELVAGGEGTFDFVLFAGLLHHLDDEQARAVVSASSALLVPGGRIAALEPLRAPGQGFVERQAYLVDRGRHVREAAGYTGLFAGSTAWVRTQSWARALRLPYTYIVLEAGGPESRDAG